MPEPITNNTRSSAAEHAPGKGATPRLQEDEVSLRELYLVLRRGLPWILGAALLAGAFMAVFNARHVPMYGARSTVLISPLPTESASTDEAQLPLSWSGALSPEAYRTLAMSQAVLEDAATRAAEAEVSPGQLRAAGSVEDLTRPNRTGESAPLTFAHTVTHSDPRAAATLADAWATSTVDAVRRLRVETLAEVERATQAEAERLEGSLQRAEAAWQDFQTQNRSALTAARTEGLTAELVEGEAQRRALLRDIDASRAVLETLRAQRQTSTPSRVADVQREEAALNGLLAEKERLEAQLRQIETSLAALPSAAQGSAARQLERAVTQAETALVAVSDAQTRAAYLRGVVPSTAQLLERAQVPAAPLESPGASRVALAAFAGALLATLLIFLRAAVASPSPLAQTTPQPSTPSHTSKTLSESRG